MCDISFLMPGCRVSCAMMAEAARLGTLAFRISWVGVFSLMSAVSLSVIGLHQLMCARRGCASLAESCPSLVFSKLLEFRDTDEVKCRNAHLSH